MEKAYYFYLIASLLETWLYDMIRQAETKSKRNIPSSKNMYKYQNIFLCHSRSRYFILNELYIFYALEWTPVKIMNQQGSKGDK